MLTAMHVLALVLILFSLEQVVLVLTVMLVSGLVLILSSLGHVFVLTVILVLRLVLVLQSGTCFSCVNSDACFGTGPDPLQSGTCFFLCVCVC